MLIRIERLKVATKRFKMFLLRLQAGETGKVIGEKPEIVVKERCRV